MGEGRSGVGFRWLKRGSVETSPPSSRTRGFGRGWGCPMRPWNPDPFLSEGLTSLAFGRRSRRELGVGVT